MGRLPGNTRYVEDGIRMHYALISARSVASVALVKLEIAVIKRQDDSNRASFGWARPTVLY
jgi:hypothetical protein